MKKRFVVHIMVAVMLLSTMIITGCGGDKTITISFDSNGGSQVESIIVKELHKVQFPKSTRDGYVFIGWLLDDELVDEEDYFPEKDVKLKAKWELIGTDGIEYFTNDPFTEERGHTVTGYNGEEREVIIPASYKGYPTLAIGEKAFDSKTDLTFVMTGNTVRDIGKNAFQHCYSLSSIVIGKSVKNIDTGAFLGCESLSQVYYCGSEKDWQNITIASENENLTSAEIWYYSDEMMGELNTWHFASDQKTIVINQKEI